MSPTKEASKASVTAVDAQTTPTKPSGKNNDEPATAPPSDASPASPQAVASKNQQCYYAYQHPTIPNSPSQDNGVYDIQSLLPQQAPASSFGHQYGLVPGLVPPLSPAVRNNSNNGDNLPPASPLFPGTAVPLYNRSSDQLETTNVVNSPSMFTSTTSPSFQYLSGPPPSPVISYGYTQTRMPNSPEHRTSWADRYVWIFEPLM